MQCNKMWLGPSISSGDREFRVPDEYPLEAAGWRIDDDGIHYIKVKGVRWFTNMEHGRHHEPYKLMTMAENIKYSKHKEVKGIGYLHYDNYDAIDIPHSDAILLPILNSTFPSCIMRYRSPEGMPGRSFMPYG